VRAREHELMKSSAQYHRQLENGKGGVGDGLTLGCSRGRSHV
jgi:hypothetical protein